MRRDQGVATIAHSDQLARLLDEIQYGNGQGPCLQALHSGQRIGVPDLAVESRWPEYRVHALADGVARSVSLPMRVDGDTVGALNLYSRRAHCFSRADVATPEGYAQQASTALALVRRHVRRQRLQNELAEGVATPAIIDQALSILMGERNITSSAAFAILSQTSQNTKPEAQ